MGAEIVAGVLDPLAQLGPLREEGLMRDLDGRAACDRVAVEAQETVPPERVEHPLHTSALIELLHLGDQRASPGRGARTVVVEADEAEEDVPHRVGRFWPERAEQRVGPLRQAFARHRRRPCRRRS